MTPLLRDAAPIVMLASALFYTNRWLALTDSETSAISDAAHNVSTLLAGFRSANPNAPPAIYALLLHSWLWITRGAFDYLRAPSILFFACGLWLLSRVARQLGGDESSNALVWLGALWPLGFHAGRLAGPYPFVFFLIAAVTWQYFRSVTSPDRSSWMGFCVLCLLLLYTIDFAWILILFLGIDYLWRNPATNNVSAEPPETGRAEKLTVVVVTAAVLVVGFLPRWPALFVELHSLAWRRSFRLLSFDAAYHFYILFVSPSVAPWFWRFSVPAGIGVLALLVLLFAGVRVRERRFLIFSLLLFALMALASILQFDRLIVVAPWFLLPMAVALGMVEKPQWRIPVAFAMAVVAAIGWYGVLIKRYYADARFFEPWNSVAQDAADAVRNGSGVISNDPTFFFYLTYELKPPAGGSAWRLTGVLPVDVQYPSVWDPIQWQRAGNPKPPGMMWIRTSSSPEELMAMDKAGDWLSDHCGDRITKFMARDASYVWEQRYIPNFSGAPWLIEIRQYTCVESVPPATSSTPSHP